VLNPNDKCPRGSRKAQKASAYANCRPAAVGPYR